MSDYIKREDVINELFRYGMTEDGEAVIRSIPSADVAPVKRGKWIKRDKCEYKCSICGKVIFSDDENERNYCGNCGAKMEADK